MKPSFAGIAHSQSMRDLLEQAGSLAAIPRPVLIRGERGTGKELLARYLHELSMRHDQPFVAINCAAFTDELLNAEMFGHEKGAFTGATEARIGKLEQAHGGTLFMDEIGNMSTAFQESILRVVEYQEFQRVRGTKTIRVNVRMLSATNADMEELIRAGVFRADLYDRLSFAVLAVPPLRQRKADIPHLIVHFVKQLHEELPNLTPRSFARETVEAMLDYYWPGNIRELRNVVERLYVFGSAETIEPSALPPEIAGTARGTGVPGEGSFHEQVEAFRRHLIIEAFNACDQNQREAARRLRMTYDQFRHYFRKYLQG